VTTIGVSISRLPSAGPLRIASADDPPARARPVLDDDRLLQLVLHPVCQQARRDVGRAAGRKADQQAHRLVDLRGRSTHGRAQPESEGDLLQHVCMVSPSGIGDPTASQGFSPLCYGARVDFALWSAIIGLLLVVMALSDSVLARCPLSTSMLYVLVGVAVSPLAFGLSSLTPTSHAKLVEHTAEVVVLLSLFTAGLKMSLGLKDGRWLLPVRLAVVSMLVTVACIAAAGTWLLGLSLGAAVLLGGILAPTDPVLASEVELENADDRDRCASR
jgi:hypothetical protein